MLSSSQMHILLACTGYGRGFVTSIMKRAKPPIPRHLLIAIVTLIISVVQLMIKRAQHQSTLVFDQQILIARMRHCGPWSKVNYMENSKIGSVGTIQ